MKNFASLFLIVFLGIAVSWFCLLVVGARALNPGTLDTTLTVAGDDVVITGTVGMAGRGKEVYQELGCVLCHTQQVRRPGFGGDLDRDWGSRQTVARDFVLQKNAILGNKRNGPDLSNVGARHDSAWFFAHLNDPKTHVDVTTMPTYPFLFEKKEMSGSSSANALKLEGNATPEEGYEVVPTQDAVALVAYLQSLNLDYDLPESKRVK